MRILGLDFGNSYTKATSTVNGNPTKSSIPSIMFDPNREADASTIGEKAAQKYFYENHLPEGMFLTHLSQRWFEKSLADKDLKFFLGHIVPKSATDKIALAIPHDRFSDERVDDLASVITKSCEGKPVLIFDACVCAAASFLSKYSDLTPSTLLICDLGGKTLKLSLCEFRYPGIVVTRHVEFGDLSGNQLDEQFLNKIQEKYNARMDAFEKARWLFELENVRISNNSGIYYYIDLVSENGFFDQPAIYYQEEALTYREAQPVLQESRKRFEEKFYEFLGKDVVDYVWVIGGLIHNGFGNYLFKNIKVDTNKIKYSDDPIYDIANGAGLLACGAVNSIEGNTHQVKLPRRRYRNGQWTDDYIEIIPKGVDREQGVPHEVTKIKMPGVKSLRFLVADDEEEKEILCTLPQNVSEEEVTLSYCFDRFGKPVILLTQTGATPILCRINLYN